MEAPPAIVLEETILLETDPSHIRKQTATLAQWISTTQKGYRTIKPAINKWYPRTFDRLP